MQKQSIYNRNWYAELYDNDRFGGTFGQYLEKLEVETFLALIDASQGKVLDVGAGTGKLSLPLLRQSRTVVSLDASQEMLSIAKTKAKNEGLALSSVICDAHNLCFRDKSFEYVICSRVLMHLRDYKRGLSELSRVARVIVLDFPPLASFGGLQSILRRLKGLFIPTDKIYNAHPTRNVINTLQSHGFGIITLKRHFFLPVAFHRWLNRPTLSFKIEKFFETIGIIRFAGAPVILKAAKLDELRSKN